MKYSENLSGSPDVQLLTSREGVKYSEFLKQLRPNYFIVYLNMIFPLLVIKLDKHVINSRRELFVFASVFLSI
jgi:hypothetical protein